MATDTFKSDLHYDIITIGSGAGAKISTPAAQLGFKCAMIEHGFTAFGERLHGLGGTCLNRGCIPSKMLIHPADVVTECNEGSRFGLKMDYKGVDFDFLVQHTSDAIGGDSNSVWDGYHEKNSMTDRRHLYTGTAKFVGPKTIKIENSDPRALKLPNGNGDITISADYVFIACGAEPAVPPIKGLENTPYLTSTEALRLKKLPKKVIVIGAGYIATELGHMYGGLGSEMHMFARTELLRTMDIDARVEFQRVFSERYHVHTGVNFHEVSFDKDSQLFTLRYFSEAEGGEKEMQADQLLVCTGVTPVGGMLDPERTGVEMSATKKGFVAVDDCLRTNVPGIWAFGDCIGNYLFRHCANFEGEYLLENVIYPLAHQRGFIKDENILKTLPKSVVENTALMQAAENSAEALAKALTYPPLDYDQGMPWAVFSNPQVAGIGAAEDDLIKAGKQEGLDYVKGINPYSKSAMGDARMSDHGLAKIIVDTKTRQILGCVVVGYEASTMVHQVIPVMKFRGKLEDLLEGIFIHPALSEILRNACRKARDELVKGGFDVPLKLRLK